MTTPDPMNSTDTALLQSELKHIQQGMQRQDTVLSQVAAAVQALPLVQHQLTNIQSDMARGSLVMAELEKRLQVVERDMPALKEIRGWVVGGVLACCAVVGGALFKLVVVDPRQPPAVVNSDPKPPRATRYLT